MSTKKSIMIIVSIITMLVGIKYIDNIYETKDTIVIDKKLHKTVQDYLDNKIRKPLDGGKVLTAYTIYGAKGNEIYLSAVFKEFYKLSDEIKETHGLMTELVLIGEKTNNGVVITNYRMPPDGIGYGKALARWFSKEAYEKYQQEDSVDSKRREKELDKRATKWFKFSQ
ncbi:hypothetical protein PV797_08685 [Clostridiaceae bacterium M8S5]|nr:hypothetical protein PV797_08685 [Clostridiaceae bacterium M8S5]